MEALILIIIVGWLVKKGVEDGHLHWQSSKAANRRRTAGQRAGRRAASAIQHDAGYWLHQVLNGFPQTRHGIAAGWHAGRTAQAQGIADRQQARADHLSLRARLAPEIREHLRRQDEALAAIRAAQQPEPEPQPTRRIDGKPETPADARFFNARDGGYKGWIDQDGHPVPEPSGLRPCAVCSRALPAGYDGAICPDCRERMKAHAASVRAAREGGETTPTTEGNAMPASGDTNYNQQLRELTAIRDDAEAEVNSVQRKRMVSRLDILQSLGLDSASLADAAAIDDALQAQEKAAHQVLDAAEAAIHGLKQRHGGIKQAVDDAPVDQPAQPEFYGD
jgi:hypothetical protein